MSTDYKAETTTSLYTLSIAVLHKNIYHFMNIMMVVQRDIPGLLLHQ